MSDAATPRPADFSPPADAGRSSKLNAAAKLNLALAGGFWVWLSAELWFEWNISDQYGYGLFVPFLTIYLVWLRWADRPVPKPWGNNAGALVSAGLVAAAQYPIAIIFAANADWRLLAWSEALLALAASAALLARWGGWPWVRHFIPALMLLLFAVPWPSRLEIGMVDDLMNLLATVVTEILNLMGYDAVRQGHVINLPGSTVLVEEACSGVRSIQYTIMAGWLVSEWWRYGAVGRVGLLAWASLTAVLFNLLRTFSVAWVDATRGPVAMARWHDPAGYLVFALSFATVIAGAWLARPRKEPGPTQDSAPSERESPHWLPTGAVIALLILLAGAWPACTTWYALRAPNAATKSGWQLDLKAAAPLAKSTTPSLDVEQVLFFDDGLQAGWTDEAGHNWSLFDLQWTRARAAQLGGVHSPESCLPAVGWYMARQGQNLDWKRGGLEIIFNTYEFVHGPTHLFVFYGQWDPAGYHYYEKTGRFRSDRLLDAWQADRKQGKQLLEVAIEHAPSLEDATKLMRQFLDQSIRETPSGGPPN